MAQSNRVMKMLNDVKDVFGILSDYVEYINVETLEHLDTAYIVVTLKIPLEKIAYLSHDDEKKIGVSYYLDLRNGPSIFIFAFWDEIMVEVYNKKEHVKKTMENMMLPINKMRIEHGSLIITIEIGPIVT